MFGVLVFIVTLLVLVLVHELGHFLSARWLGVTVEEFGFGFPPAALKRRWGRTVYSLNWLPLGGFVKIKGEEHAVEESDSFSAQPSARRALIVASGVIMNLALCWLLFTVGFTVGMPQEATGPARSGAKVRDVRHQVTSVLPQSPAEGALESGDTIVAIDGESFATLQELQRYIRSHRDGLLEFTVERRGAVQSLSLQPALLKVSEGEVYGVGVSLFTTAVVSYPLYRAPLEALRLTGELFGAIARALGDLISGLWRGAPPAVEVAGPIGIAVLTAEVVDLGWIFLLQFVAVLSLNLAFVNLLPFPALDGGRLLFIGIEVARGRRVSHSVEGALHRWGFTVLLFLVLLVTYFDLLRFGGAFGQWLQGLRRIVS
jgi:regulator of sigma E protease